jgi:hypothetical protein
LGGSVEGIIAGCAGLWFAVTAAPIVVRFVVFLKKRNLVYAIDASLATLRMQTPEEEVEVRPTK